VSEYPVPDAIHRADGAVTITWAEDHVGRYAARDLRLACQCAVCREEMTGRPLLDPAAVPDDVIPLRVSLVGGYAIRIDWSDGHSTGLYTYDYLLAICPCERCGGRDGKDGKDGKGGTTG
jgi:ATP-binding protein involved in chromosome partitioning